MAVFHTPHDCFVSAEYHAGDINIASALQQYQTGLTSGGYTITPSSNQVLTLKTNTGNGHYQLQQYTVSETGSGGAPEGGQEFGYLQLTNGYVKLEGYCDTANELAETLPALQAIAFDSARK